MLAPLLITLLFPTELWKKKHERDCEEMGMEDCFSYLFVKVEGGRARDGFRSGFYPTRFEFILESCFASWAKCGQLDA